MKAVLISLDFNLSLGDVLLALGMYLAIAILIIYLIVTYLRNFRKKGTASEFVTNRIFPKLFIVCLILLVLYAFLST